MSGENTLTIAGALIQNKENDGYLKVDVVIDGGKISSITECVPDAPPSFPKGVVVDGSGKLLLPGFVNAHTHSSEMWVRGEIPPLPLELWLATVIDYMPQGVEYIYYSCLITGIETIKSGGTALVDHLTPEQGKIVESIEQAARAYRELGVRAFIAPLTGDLPLEYSIPAPPNAPKREFVTSNTAEILRDLEIAIQRFHDPENGIHMMVGPTGIQRCSDEFYKGCIELSNKYGLARHTHCLETRAQSLLAEEKYGCTAVKHLENIGFLGPSTSCAHTIWLTDEDIEIFKRTGTTAVHNAVSNLRLGSGIAPMNKFRNAGVNVSIGCDGAASNDGQDLFEAIKLGTMLHTITDPDYRNWLRPRQTLKMASLGGATGLGLQDKLGTIEVGKIADLVLYDLSSLSLLPRTDPIGLLVMGRPTPDVIDSVWVNGKRILGKGNVLNVDEAALRNKLATLSEWKLTPRPSPLCASLEQGYRRALGLSDD